MFTKNEKDKYEERAVELVGVQEGIITFKWKDDGKNAFTLEKNESGKIKLKILSSPGTSETRNFKVDWLDVPIDKAKLANSPDETEIENCAEVTYNKEKVCATIDIPHLVQKNISKTGKLSENFSDPQNRKIEWTSSFNFKDYLGEDGDPEKDRIYTVKDEFGIGDDTKDSVTMYNGRDSTVKDKDLQSIDYERGDLSEHIQLSLGQLDENGTKVNEYSGKEEFQEGNHYRLELTSSSKSFELTITLTPKGKKIYR
ncbi:hypothetical protein [Lentilactobacillus kisonensis]|uniref:hypothetical protein n=1 Tax=Lentilactobacillus kisonensis TaxID=481722 RepID=UPI0006D07602|nr:hypothetical protein [Lentilactobacillus kisonensis]